MSDSCGCCKGYEKVVDRLATELKISVQKQNINDGVSYKLKGVPTVILEDDNGNMIYESIGNLPYEYLIKGIKDKIDVK